MLSIGVISSSDRNIPDAPTIGTATDVGTARAFNNGAASVTFTAPTYTGNSPITSYTVTSAILKLDVGEGNSYNCSA